MSQSSILKPAFERDPVVIDTKKETKKNWLEPMINLKRIEERREENPERYR